MIDIKYIKENPDEVVARLAKKGKDAKEDIENILRLDAERRTLISETETLKADQNKTNKLIPQYKKEGKDFLEKYNRMLKETPVHSVEDAAKICDIDLTKKEFWLMSLHSYDEAISEFKRLAKK